MRILVVGIVIGLSTLGCADVLGLDRYGAGGSGGGGAAGGSGGGGASGGAGGVGATGGSGGAGGTGAMGGSGGASGGGSGGAMECVPQVEDCASPEDESCDGAAGCTGAHRWSTLVGSPGQDGIGAVAVDGEGSTIIVGSAAGPINFGGGQKPNKGGPDMFVAKLLKDGSPQWSHTFGGADVDLVRAVVVDRATGNIYVAGRCGAGGCDIAAPAIQGEIIAAFDSSGTLQWAWPYSAGGVEFRDLALSDDGKVLAVAGVYTGNPVLQGPAGAAFMLPGSAASSVLVASIAADTQEVIWAKGFGDGAVEQNAYSIAIAAGGDVVVTVNMQGTLDFDPLNAGDELVSAGGSDIAVARLSGADGSHVWSRRFGGAALQQAAQVRAAADGGFVVGGIVAGVVQFGACGTPAGNSNDAVVWKLDAAGECVWVHRADVVSYQQVSSLDLDPAGNLLVSGSFQGNFDFSGRVEPLQGADGRYVMKLDPAGKYLWQRGFQSSPGAFTAAPADGLGGVSVLGTLDGTTTFGGGPLISQGMADLVIASLAP